MAQTDVIRAFRDSLEGLLKSIGEYSTEGADGARRIGDDFAPFVNGAFHRADTARVAAWARWIEPYFEVVQRGVTVFPPGARPRANMRAEPGSEAETAELREGRGGADPVVWSALTSVRQFFGSIDYQQPFAGKWRFSPLVPESMTVSAQAVASLRMALNALESVGAQAGPVVDEKTALRVLSGREVWGVDELPAGISAEALGALDSRGLVEARSIAMPRAGQTRDAPREPIRPKRREPLSGRSRSIYDLLIQLKPHQAMLLPELLRSVPDSISEAVFYRDLKPELEPWGLKNKPKVGYYIERE